MNVNSQGGDNCHNKSEFGYEIGQVELFGEIFDQIELLHFRMAIVKGANVLLLVE
jgi:hypothetical protein